MTININHFQFHSSDHVRFQSGQDVSGHNRGCNRGIEIIKHPSIQDAFRVSIYNLDGNHPVWGDNLQMAPKVMKVVSNGSDKIALKGYGNDPMGVPFSTYGLTIHLKNESISKVVLHMFDRGVDIEYFE